ncbi:MAG TPA: acyclic terpene utilization AtuA family protein [Acidimicrobiia bacterium]
MPDTRDTSRPVRIANCSGFFGDRLAALREVVEGGPVDVVTGDYLAEVTMLILARTRLRRPGQGYASSFLRQLEPVAGTIAARGIKVVVNAGGLDPQPLADATRELLARAGVELSVAHVEGDDITGRIDELLAAGETLAHLDTGKPFSSWAREPLTANAYLGGFGIAAALRGGADIVVTGRVADASLVTGAAAWWWDWSPTDHDALAGAVVAGHVIECGAQATGGNYSRFGSVARLDHPGFPIAEVARDGSAVITKHPDSDGAVTVGTVTAQLLYEVGPPGYLNPDAVAHLDTVRLMADGDDRVRITGVRGSAPPPTTKVAMTALGAWRNASTVVLTGLDLDAKAAVVESAIRSELADRPGIDDLRFTRIGIAADDPADQMLGSCLLHVSVDGTQDACGRAFSNVVVELALASIPGIYFTGPPGDGGPFGVYWPTLVSQAALEHVVVHADGRREFVAMPPTAPTAAPVAPSPHVAAPSDLDDAFGPTVDAPLGTIVQARSGDKGGNANVGLWVDSDDAFAWLRNAITVDRVHALLPEAADLDVDRYELPNLRAVNFVIRGLLDGGATEARRFDKQAKALGEWIRARHVPIPARFLD